MYARLAAGGLSPQSLFSNSAAIGLGSLPNGRRRRSLRESFPQKIILRANWICRDEVTVRSSCPAVATATFEDVVPFAVNTVRPLMTVLKFGWFRRLNTSVR